MAEVKQHRVCRMQWRGDRRFDYQTM